MTPWLIERRSLADPQVQQMISRLDAELRAASPPGVINFLTVGSDDFTVGEGAFLVAMVDGTAAACGAYRRIDASAAEIKRMWSDPARRRLGLATGILDALIEGASNDGYLEIRLETGEYLTDAIALYRRFGFERCEPWGDYVGAPLSMCMSRSLR